MPMKPNEREYRNFTLEARKNEQEQEDESRTVTGYASTYNEPYTLYEDEEIEIRDQVAPEAFNDADMSDVIMQYDHEGRVFARKSNGTLTVEPDEHGLAITAELGGTELGRQLYEEIRGGYTTKMSFGFTVPDDGETWYEETREDGIKVHTRTITRVRKVYDVSAVSLPANDGTAISVRNLSEGVIEKVKAERLKTLEIERRRLELRLRLLRGGNKNE